MSYTISSKPSVLMSKTNSELTPEQIQRMEENRLKALAKKKASSQNNTENNNPTNIHSFNSKPSIFNNPAPKPSIFNNPSKINTLNSVKPTFANQSTSTSKATDNFSLNKPVAPLSSAGTGLVDSTHGRCIPLEEDPENRFEIIIGYNKGVVELFKTIKGKKYDPNTKRWNFPRKQYDDIILQIKHQLNDTIKLEPLDRSAGTTTFLKFFLISRTKFEAVCTDFRPELNEVFKGIKSKNYDTTRKRFTFDLSDYDKLIELVTDKLKGSLTIIPLPKTVREIFKDQISGITTDKSKESRINLDYLKEHVDPQITKSLLSFQVESICFAIRQEGRLLLADDMGLGKTIQGLAIASYYRKEGPVLIVCPSSVKFMWKENAKRWISWSIRDVCDLDEDDEVDDYILVLENGRQKIDKKAKIVVSSYDLVAKNVDEILTGNFNMVIADECHLLKNIKAIRTRSTLRLLESAKRVLLMSGTPALSRPAELFSQISAINPNLFNNFHEFGVRYCDGKETKFGMDYSGYSNMNELKTILEENLLIRREKKDVMSELPSKMRETIILNPALIELNSKTLKKAMEHLKLLQEIEKEGGKAGMDKHGALLKAFSETSQVKAKAVAEYVLDLLEAGKKFLVFAHHQAMLDHLQGELVENKYDFIRIDGSTASEQRQVLVDRFQKDEKCLCALLSITAANSGITLTAASLVCFAELYWNPGILVQAEDRVYRIGQKNAVNIQYLCARGTADDDMWKMIGEKLEILSKVGLTKESMTGTKESVIESSKEDIEKLTTFKELNPEKEEFKKQKNKITNYTEKSKSEDNLEKISELKSKENKKTKLSKSQETEVKKKEDKKSQSQETSSTGKNGTSSSHANIEKILEGLDYSDFMTQPEPIVTTTGKKTTPPRKISDVLDDDDELLAGVNLKAFEENSPPKKQRSIFKKK